MANTQPAFKVSLNQLHAMIPFIKDACVCVCVYMYTYLLKTSIYEQTHQTFKKRLPWKMAIRNVRRNTEETSPFYLVAVCDVFNIVFYCGFKTNFKN